MKNKFLIVIVSILFSFHFECPASQEDNCFRISISSVNLPDDVMVVSLSPTAGKGTLSIYATKRNGGETLLFTENNVKGGVYNITTWRDKTLANTEYTGFKGKWGTEATTTTTYKFKNLGTYRNSVYNIPWESESSCQSGGRTSVIFSTASCAFADGKLYETFRDRVGLNGSGKSLSGDIILEWSCTHSWAKGGKAGRSATLFRKERGKGACNLYLDETSVAINKNNPDLKCGDSVYIKDIGLKKVNDNGGGLSLTQLDNFDASTGRCSTFSDLGQKVVFKLIK